MITLTIASQKGGVGKTTVALNLAFALAQRGWRTLIVDTDPQGALGLSLTPRVSASRGLVDCLLDGAAPHEVVIQTRVSQLAILPLGKLSIDRLVAYEEAVQDGRLYEVLTQLEGRYDLAILDTAAGFGATTVGALCAASYLITPVQAEPVALRSLPQLLDWIGWLRERGAPVELLGVVISMLQEEDPHSRRVAEELWERFPRELILEPPVPRDPAFLHATAAGVPVGLLSRTPPEVARVFDQLALSVEARVRLQAEGGEDGPLPFVD